MAFIFEEHQKELVIEVDGDVFNNAVFNLMTAFAENVNYVEHKIEFSLYKQNTENFLKNVTELSNLYKAGVPQIQQLPAFFKQQ